MPQRPAYLILGLAVLVVWFQQWGWLVPNTLLGWDVECQSPIQFTFWAVIAAIVISRQGTPDGIADHPVPHGSQ